jgi:glucoamylase
VHWSSDQWRTVHDDDTAPNALGIYVVDLPSAAIAAGGDIVFTFFWLDAGAWENVDYSVAVI